MEGFCWKILLGLRSKTNRKKMLRTDFATHNTSYDKNWIQSKMFVCYLKCTFPRDFYISQRIKSASKYVGYDRMTFLLFYSKKIYE